MTSNPIDRKEDYAPHIKLQTALSICGAELLEASGKIAGMAIGNTDVDAAVKRYVLGEVEQRLAKLNQRIAEYTVATFVAPKVTPEQYDEMVARERREASAS